MRGQAAGFPPTRSRSRESSVWMVVSQFKRPGSGELNVPLQEFCKSVDKNAAMMRNYVVIAIV